MAIYDKNSTEPFRISRSKIDLFLECPRCFYLDRRLGISRPSMPGFSLNNAVDTLLKKEFDIHRADGNSHPLMRHYGLDAVPFRHEKMDEWRDSLRRGIQYLHPKTNLLITGGIDDVWITRKKELIIVDYKATATTKEISLEDEYKQGYKKQMEIYQWLFRKNDFEVDKTGYFLFCNGLTDREAFDGKLEFNMSLISHEGDDSWIEPTIVDIKKTLDQESVPECSPKCEYCHFVSKAKEVESY